MQLKSLSVCLLIIMLMMNACKKQTVSIAPTYIEPSDLRVGTYQGMFQECGPVICYNKDTSFQITKENHSFYVLFGNHKDEIEFSNPAALEFSGVEVFALDSSGNNYGSVLSGSCRNDSAIIKFANGWGVDNNNLLSGKLVK